jgi:hypothetical protein
VDRQGFTPWRTDATRRAVSKCLLTLAGLASFCLSAFGALASLGLDYRTCDMFLILCFVLPFPAFLSFLQSFRLATVSLWILFLGQWIVRQFLIGTHRPSPALNPLSGTGGAYFGIALAMQVAFLMRVRTWTHDSPRSHEPPVKSRFR